MAKVTGKLQITLSKALADQCGIRVGDELNVRATGWSIQLERRSSRTAVQQRRERLEFFDRATRRQQARQAARPPLAAPSRGWTRESLYGRGRPR